MPNYNANNSKKASRNNASSQPITVNSAGTVVAVPLPRGAEACSPANPFPAVAFPPAIPVANVVAPTTRKLLPSSVAQLKSQGYTNGLIESISNNTNAFPHRIWVVDNSGSMTTPDGHRLLQTSDNFVKAYDCTRWSEIQDTVSYHARVATLLEAPTSFRLLNPTLGMREFGVAERPDHIQEDLAYVLHHMRGISPSGVTPLTKRVTEISAYIQSIKNDLVSKGQKTVIVLATDGLPSDRFGESSQRTMKEFQQALQSMEGLPIWLVIRLCTDDEEVVNFYNNIDSHLEMSCDVLDDFFAEALEVYEHNNWLNYALPLHRMREMGFYHKLFDLIDERSLTKDELKDFFLLIYGADALDGIPDPQLDWDRFIDRIAVVTSEEKLQYNPVRKRMMPWVDIKRLGRKYGGASALCKFF